MSEFVELIVVIAVFGIIGILCIYAYQSILEVLSAITSLGPLQTDFDNILGRIDGIFNMAEDIKKALAGLEHAAEDIKKVFGGIFDMFGVLKNILIPVCEATKIAGAAGKGISKVGSLIGL